MNQASPVSAAPAADPAFKAPAPSWVRAISPYVAGKPIEDVARELGLSPDTIVKLASNENPLGMPASAREAMIEAAVDLGRYPDANGFALKAALSKRFALPMEWITLGNGSNDILELAAHAFLEPGKQAIYSQYSFAVYELATQAVGAQAIVTPAKDFGHDLDAMLAAVTPSTQLVFIANPNNPTGTFLPYTDIERFLDALPRHVVCVLDEAYNEYLPPELRVDTARWVERYPNLLISRTFSKAYGLAGLRVGYGLAQPEVTGLLNRIRQPFNVNALAQAAAVAALADDEFLERSYALNQAGLKQIGDALSARGLQWVRSYGNFILFKVGEEAAAGARVNQALLKQGVIVRPVGNYGLPQWIRVSIGLPEENARFIAALATALA
ncbi:MAG TPA: histidinol-phosphate transaminase [Burkholderiaceae bacterium]|nr:histidinol-phosphate transaminase [Burkholderiaceae bacterium]